jgi:hypothetical protein
MTNRGCDWRAVSIASSDARPARRLPLLLRFLHPLVRDIRHDDHATPQRSFV